MILSKKTSEIVRTFGLIALLLFFVILISQTLGLSRGGFSDSSIFNQYIFYAIPAIGFALGISVLFILQYYYKRNESVYGSSLSFNTSDDTLHVGRYFNFIKNPFKLTILSIILFSFLGLYVTYTKQTFFNIAVLKNQFTILDGILFSTNLVPISENLGLAFLLASVIFALRYYAIKFNWDKTSFIIITYLACIISGGIYGALNHLSIYGNSELALVSVMIFWALGSLLTVATGSFIPFLVMHIINNFFIDLSKYYSNEIIVIWTIISIILLTVVYVITISLGKKLKKRDEGLVNI